ncbi:MAG: pyridoxal phosphate-dependent aminotransferase [Candidatus Daviesbacteria bacterium]|nr:pyridoxal phosphate-dependent aminotransferase [Candidatus Daviesbacteria bacterium]
MSLTYKKMFDYGDLMSQKPDLIRLETMDYDLKTFKMPQIFRQVMLDVLDNHKLRYSDLGGMKALTDQILKYELALNPSLKLKSKPAIFVGNGVSEVLFSAIRAILQLPENNGREEILLFVPGFSLFETSVKVAGGKVRFVKGLRRNNFIPAITQIRNKVTKQTCAIVFANPNNPTTVGYKEKFLEELIKLAKARNLFLVSDEIYGDMVRKPRKHVQTITLNNGLKNLVKVFGPSKDRPGMTGLKIGYLIADSRLNNSLTTEYLARNDTINILSEHIFLVDLALRTKRLTGVSCDILSNFSVGDIEEYYETVQSNYERIFDYQDRIMRILKSSNRVVDYIVPQGCNMIFVKYYKDLSHADFFNRMLKQGIGLYPGDVFHINEDQGQWFRICITQSFEKIQHGMERFL